MTQSNPESAVGVKPGDSAVVIGYQVDEFTQAWLVEHFPLEPGCEDYSFLDQAVSDFQHGLDSILPDSINTLELVASFDDPDATSAVSSGFLHSVGTISDHFKP